MEFRILGPLEVGADGRAVALGGAKPRAVLAVLVLHANQPVSAERLALAVWGENAPAGAVKTVQVHVSRLRKALGDADVLVTTPAGYRLQVNPGELDAEHFDRQVAAGRQELAAGRADRAADLLREALALWRGAPLAEFAWAPFAPAEINRLHLRRAGPRPQRQRRDPHRARRHREFVQRAQRPGMPWGLHVTVSGGQAVYGEWPRRSGGALRAPRADPVPRASRRHRWNRPYGADLGRSERLLPERAVTARALRSRAAGLRDHHALLVRDPRTPAVQLQVDDELRDARGPVERLAFDAYEREVAGVEPRAEAFLHLLQPVARDREGEFQHIAGVDDFEPASGDVDLLQRLLARGCLATARRRSTMASAFPGTHVISAPSSRQPARAALGPRTTPQDGRA